MGFTFLFSKGLRYVELLRSYLIKKNLFYALYMASDNTGLVKLQHG
jgi:hypothetical protein